MAPTWWPKAMFPKLARARAGGAGGLADGSGVRPAKRMRASEVHRQALQNVGEAGSSSSSGCGPVVSMPHVGAIKLLPVLFAVKAYKDKAMVMERWALPVANAYAVKAGHALGSTFRDRKVWLDSHGMKEGSAHMFLGVSRVDRLGAVMIAPGTDITPDMFKVHEKLAAFFTAEGVWQYVMMEKDVGIQGPNQAL